MSSVDDEGFVSEDELNSLLGKWVAPGPSRVLDKRIATSFAREFSGADGLPEPALLPQRREVVSMKFCAKCEEEFADKFSFCPVDGTPLSSVVAKSEEPSVTVAKDKVAATPPVPVVTPPPAAVVASMAAAASDREPPLRVSVPVPASSALALRDEYHLTIMDDAGLIERLSSQLKDTAHEYQLTWPEFKRDPFGFTKRTVIGYGTMLRKFLGNRNVLVAMGVAVLAMLALIGAVALLDRSGSTRGSRIGVIVFAVIAAGMLVALFSMEPDSL